MLPRFAYDSYQKLFYPKDIDIIRECVVNGDFSRYPTDYDPTDPNRPKVPKFGARNSLEENASKLGYSDDPNYQPYRDSTGSKRQSFLKKMFGKKEIETGPGNLNSASIDTLQTEEIEMEFTEGGRDNNGKATRPSFNLKPTAEDRKKSLDKTRKSLQLETGRSSMDIRPSLDLPELTTADGLIGRLSFEHKK
ncbi:unnamed protein product [Ambrosiozyma monospora]|uniref:Unnamed protein product n=1 Tax=Ambrosiozyma monospora TaxID=43982 RepID=A0A9W6YSM1_AMBMO|nr:unnamed protein product [Ambrosiozyma monospora]